MDGGASNSKLTISTGTKAHNQVWILRALGAGGRKAALPVRYLGTLTLSQRVANQHFSLGLIAGPNGGGALWYFSGVDPTTAITHVASGGAATEKADSAFTLPGGGDTTMQMPFAIDVRGERATFYAMYNGVLTMNTLAIHLPGPYEDLYFGVIARNDDVPASSTDLVLDWHTCQSLDVVETNDIEAQLLLLQIAAALKGVTSDDLAATYGLPGGRGLAISDLAVAVLLGAAVPTLAGVPTNPTMTTVAPGHNAVDTAAHVVSSAATQGSGTPALVNVASSAAAVTILAANPTRMKAPITNVSPGGKTLFLRWGHLNAGVTPGTYVIALPPGGFYEFGAEPGELSGIWGDANGAVADPNGAAVGYDASHG